MVSIFQDFEFVYPEGDLFFDRSGALTRRLRTLFPGLVSKETDLNQREFSVSPQNLNLLFGIALSQIQTFAIDDRDFSKKASQFLECVCETFEIASLNRFSYKHILGRTCSTLAQAQELMWPLIGDEQKAKLAALSPLPSWTAVQGEFTHGPFAYESRIAIMNLRPDSELNVGSHLLEKMRSIVFPTVQFAGASVEEAVEYLTIKSRDLDTTGKETGQLGVAIELDSTLTPASAALSLDLRDIPMLEALRYVVELAGLKFKLAPDRVLIVDRLDTGDLPHITVHLKATGLEPISLADFDAAAFILNFRETHSQEILSKLAPHFAKS